MSGPPGWLMVVIAGLFGAAGVALWAYATHAGAAGATIAAQILLIHAAALVALAAAIEGGLLPQRSGGWAMAALALGVVLFSGDLAARALFGQRLFPMASPLGGVLMIGGWLAVAIAGLLRRHG